MKTLLITAFFLLPLLVQAQEWQSSNKQAQLVELYTSEGCSSCPPADKWLSTLKDHPKLFDHIVPIAMHVDYWDYIGWKDPFASPEYSQRQRQYARDGHISQVYTPGFVVNNKEWRSWFYGQRQLPEATKETGKLHISLDDNNILQASYSENKNVTLHVSYLGMGLTTKVRAGENRNKQLNHDFVALNHLTLPGNQNWTLLLPEAPNKGQQKTAIAAWVSDNQTNQVLQAVGGYLEKN
ncbi:DUF1223 domain-containing protein [Marinomonas sp. C2222]|uniref:DUF1223 domain-containing protein n=1 Tax=Marinomonas sargassi TaxID=2984494 RepID=A0ABT2YPB2_9GAMM|nr:DUF1223 domain-containing protein [Marinomonas sargassi]MCV2401727.1 DUF1223 domain-containing protein [Marinomonas sargassi]